MQPGLRVDDKHEQVSLVDCLDHLALYFHIHWQMRIVGQTTGIDEPELTVVPVSARKMPVSRRTRFIAYDCGLVTDNAIEERGLADVGPANKSDYGNVHAATASSSPASMSMKS